MSGQVCQYGRDQYDRCAVADLGGILSEFEVRADTLYEYSDPPLYHLKCGQVVCTVEDKDDLALLVRTAMGHECSTPHD